MGLFVYLVLLKSTDPASTWVSQTFYNNEVYGEACFSRKIFANGQNMDLLLHMSQKDSP